VITPGAKLTLYLKEHTIAYFYFLTNEQICMIGCLPEKCEHFYTLKKLSLLRS